MIPVGDLPREVLTLGGAIGLIRKGQLDEAFFSDPLAHVRAVLADPDQRVALLGALDTLLQPRLGDDPAPGVSRHPLAVGSHGAIALSVTRSGPADAPTVVLGFHAHARHADTGAVIEMELPLVQAGADGVVVVLAGAEHPLSVGARLPVAWRRPEHPIGLDGIGLSALLVAEPADRSRFVLTLTGMDTGTGHAGDVVLDAGDLAEGAAPAVVALLQAAFSRLETAPDDAVARLVAHLPAVLGLAGGVPPLPFSGLAGDPHAFRGWLADLAAARGEDAAGGLGGRLDAVAQLLGAAPGSGGGSPPDRGHPFRLQLVTSGAGVGLAVEVWLESPAAGTASALHVSLVASLPGPSAAVAARAELLVVPLAGDLPARVLPSAELVVESNGPLWPRAGDDAELRVGVVRAGLRYDGVRVAPVLELDDVHVGLADLVETATDFPRLDLGQARTLAAVAKDTVGAFLTHRIGGGPAGEAVMTLLGLEGSPVPADRLGAFANDPLAAVRAAHLRAAATGDYPRMIRALATLLGVGGDGGPVQVSGTGTADDPWQVALTALPGAAGSRVAAGLVAWDVPGADQGHELHFGLAFDAPAAAGRPTWSLGVRTDLAVFRLPARGPATTGYLASVRCRTELRPARPADADVTADTLTLTALWQAGAPLRVSGALTGVTVLVDGNPVTLGTVTLPDGPAPPAAAASWWGAVRGLLAHGADAWGGPFTSAVARLTGLTGTGSALPGTWPVLSLPTPDDLDSLLTDPLRALRAWMAALVGAPSDASGHAPLPAALDLLRDALGGTQPAVAEPPRSPAVAESPRTPSGPPVDGSGTYDDPWAVPFAGPADLLVWLDPAPPAGWRDAPLDLLGNLPSGAEAAAVLATAAHALAPWFEPVRTAFSGRTRDGVEAVLAALAERLDGTDGLVPVSVAGQVPAGVSVTDAVPAAHHRLPQHPDVVTAVTGHLAAHAAGLPVLLLAPAFAPADVWAPLLAGVAPDQRVTVDLRRPGLDPDTIDLGGISAGSHYLVDLADDGTTPPGDSDLTGLAARLDRVVTRVLQVTKAPAVALVGHSVDGLTALAHAAAHPDRCHAVVVLGTPLAPLAAATVLSPAAEGVRWVRHLLPGTPVGASDVDAALELLAGVLDGYRGTAPSPFPAAAFGRSLPAGSDLHAVPALAVPGRLGTPVLTSVARSLADAVRAATPAPPEPTHLGIGLRARLDCGRGTPSPAGVEALLDLRLDTGRTALTEGAAAPPEPAHRVSVQATVCRPDGWLAGGAGDGKPLGVRARAATLRLDNAAGVTTFGVRLLDAAVRGDGLPSLGVDDPRAEQALAALIDTLAAGRATGDPADGLLRALTGLGIVAQDARSGAFSVRADAIGALRFDPSSFLAPGLRDVLEAHPDVLGLTADAPVAGAPRTWRHTLGGLPLECAVTDGPWSIAVRTTGEGLALGGADLLQLSAGQELASGTGRVEARLRAAGADLSYDGPAGTLDVRAPGVLDLVRLLPTGDPGAVREALLSAVRRTATAAALSAAIDGTLGGGLRLGCPAGLLAEPGPWLAAAGRLGTADGMLSADAVTRLLGGIAHGLGLPVDAGGAVRVADGLTLSATPAAQGTGLVLGLHADHLSLAGPTGPGLDGDLTLGVLGARRAVLPGGALTLTVPLASGLAPLHLEAGAGPDGTLALSAAFGTGAPVELLPHFDGLWDLLGGGVQALLPGTLDALVTRLATPSPLVQAALGVAEKLDVYIPATHRFSSDALATLAGQAHDGHPGLAPAVQHLLSTALPAGTPVTVTSDATGVALVLDPLPAGGGLRLSARMPGAGTAPGLGLELTDVRLGAVTAALSVAEDPATGALNASLAATADAAQALGFPFAPVLTASGPPLTVRLLPLGQGSPLAVELAPAPGIGPGRSALGGLITAWAVPTALGIALDTAGSALGAALWNGGPSAHELLRGATLVDDDATGRPRPRTVMPSVSQAVQGLLAEFGRFRLPVAQGVEVGALRDGDRMGLVLTGEVPLQVGEFDLTLHLGKQLLPSWPEPGVGVLLLRPDGGGPAVVPEVRLDGVGVGLRKGGDALVDTDALRIRAVSGCVEARIDLTGDRPVLLTLHGGVDIEQIGLPIASPAQPPNPVAASLLKPGDQETAGDAQPANPPVDLFVGSDDSGSLQVTVQGRGGDQVFLVDVHKTYGPLHIDRIGLRHQQLSDGDAIGVLIDGGVSVAGLTVQAQGLELDVPLRHAASPDRWPLDLAGLALSFAGGPVSIAGGLLKVVRPDQTVEYDGELSIQVAGVGLTALGAYARPADTGGDPYTSLFVFLIVDAPLGGPPFLFVTGLAGGAGYNRQLIVPADPAQIQAFPLMAALRDGVGGDPMATLHAMSSAMPARRGSYWIAGGVRFTTFELLHTEALAYAALDRGFEIGLLGLMTMALPTRDTALVSVELALAARYSSAEQLLAVRAQLTNNSWLISRDCQLTGGFAFYSWFGEHPQVVLTIGGYGPFFQPPPAYPVVPRVGFHWSVGGGIVVKGESYFTLTSSSLQFGGRLEAAYELGPIRLWFLAWLDALLCWDPLHYGLDLGVSIGATFHITIDLLFCSISLSISVSLGASLRLEGPPLHGRVTVDLAIATVSVDFGPQPAVSPFLPWGDFAAKYLSSAGGPERGAGTSGTTVTSGQLAGTGAPGSANAPQPDGGRTAPWPVLPEFSISASAKAPLASVEVSGALVGGQDDSPYAVVQVGPQAGAVRARLRLVVERLADPAQDQWVTVNLADAAPQVLWGSYPQAVWLGPGGQQEPKDWCGLAAASPSPSPSCSRRPPVSSARSPTSRSRHWWRRPSTRCPCPCRPPGRPCRHCRT